MKKLERKFCLSQIEKRKEIDIFVIPLITVRSGRPGKKIPVEKKLNSIVTCSDDPFSTLSSLTTYFSCLPAAVAAATDGCISCDSSLFVGGLLKGKKFFKLYFLTKDDGVRPSSVELESVSALEGQLFYLHR